MHIRWEFLLCCGAVWPLFIRTGCELYPDICGPWWLWTHLPCTLLSCSLHLDTMCCACVLCFTMFSCRDYYSRQAVTHKANIWFHCNNRVIQFRQYLETNQSYLHSFQVEGLILDLRQKFCLHIWLKNLLQPYSQKVNKLLRQWHHRLFNYFSQVV